MNIRALLISGLIIIAVILLLQSAPIREARNNSRASKLIATAVKQIEENKDQEATESINSAINIPLKIPTRLLIANTLANYGWEHKITGNKEKSSRFYRYALSTLSEAVAETSRWNKEQQAQYYTLMGDIAFGSDDALSAFAHYEKALALMPDNPHLLNNYAYRLAESDMQLPKALDLARKAFSLSQDPVIEDTLGWALYKNGQASEAVTHLENAVAAVHNDRGEIAHHLGLAYIAVSKYKEAFAVLIKAESLSQGTVRNTQIKADIALVKRLMKTKDNAVPQTL